MRYPRCRVMKGMFRTALQRGKDIPIAAEQAHFVSCAVCREDALSGFSFCVRGERLLDRGNARRALQAFTLHFEKCEWCQWLAAWFEENEPEEAAAANLDVAICADLDRLLSAREADPRVAVQIREHLNTCQRCRRDMETMTLEALALPPREQVTCSTFQALVEAQSRQEFRMTPMMEAHIAACHVCTEEQRQQQMDEYLAVLRTFGPLPKTDASDK